MTTNTSGVNTNYYIGTAPKNKKGRQLRTYNSVSQCKDRLSIKMSTQAVLTFPNKVVQGVPRLSRKDVPVAAWVGSVG